MTNPPLTPQAFDRIAKPKAPGNPLGLVWTASAIGRCIGASPDFVRETLANEPGSPVKKIGRKYVAQIDDLIDYFSNRQNKPI
jgi:hypothetical protein